MPVFRFQFADSLSPLPDVIFSVSYLSSVRDASIFSSDCPDTQMFWLVVEGALRASDTANPPLNMRRALIFQGAFICGVTIFVAAIQGKQKRRELD